METDHCSEVMMPVAYIVHGYRDSTVSNGRCNS